MIILSKRDIGKLVNAKSMKSEQRDFGKEYIIKFPKAIVRYKFDEPQYNVQTGDNEINVSGYIIVKINGKRVEKPFDGKLHQGKSMGAYRPLKNEINMSFQDANEKLNNVIPNVEEAVSEILKRMPTKTKKQKMIEKKERIKEEKEKIKEEKEQGKQPKIKQPVKQKETKQPEETFSQDVEDEIKVKSQVKVNLKKLSRNYPDKYKKLQELYPNIDNFPYGVVYSINQSGAEVIFKDKADPQNVELVTIPLNHLSLRNVETPEKAREEKMNSLVEFYEDSKGSPETIKQMGNNLIGYILKYKLIKNLRLDNFDKEQIKKLNIKNPNEKENIPTQPKQSEQQEQTPQITPEQNKQLETGRV